MDAIARLARRGARRGPRLGRGGLGRRRAESRCFGSSAAASAGSRTAGPPIDDHTRVRRRVADQADGDGRAARWCWSATAGSISPRRSAAGSRTPRAPPVCARSLGHAAGCAAHVEFFRWLRDGAGRSARRPRRARRTRAVGAARVADLQRPRLHPARRDRRARRGAAARACVRRARRRARSGSPPASRATPIAMRSRPSSTIAASCAGSFTTRTRTSAAASAATPGCSPRSMTSRAFAAAIVDTAVGTARGRFRSDVVTRFFTDAPTPGAIVAARLGHAVATRRASRMPAIAGRAPARSATPASPARRSGSICRAAAGSPCSPTASIPTRHANTADAIKALRRAVGDAAVAALDG